MEHDFKICKIKINQLLYEGKAYTVGIIDLFMQCIA